MSESDPYIIPYLRYKSLIIGLVHMDPSGVWVAKYDEARYYTLPEEYREVIFESVNKRQYSIQKNSLGDFSLILYKD